MTRNERIIDTAFYLLQTQGTLRKVAKHFSIGKSTAHIDMTVRLRELDTPLYKEVQKLLTKNKEERHLRGGNATRQKYICSQKQLDTQK